MATGGPTVPGWLAGMLIGVVVGGLGGYYTASWYQKPPYRQGPSMAQMMAAGMGGGGGRGGANGAADHPNAAALMRAISGVTVLEQAHGNELSADQRQKVLAVASSLQGGSALSEAECDAKVTALQAVLKPEQKEFIDQAVPQRGGGGRGGRAGGGGASGGRPGGAGSSGGGRGQVDFDHPFQEGPAHDRLTTLVSLLKK